MSIAVALILTRAEEGHAFAAGDYLVNKTMYRAAPMPIWSGCVLLAFFVRYGQAPQHGNAL